MRRPLLALLMILAAGLSGLSGPSGAPSVPGRAQAQEGCQYVLGFLLLYQLIPDVMGTCVSNETPSPNGDSLQQTTSGLAVYRKADNWTAFTDGFRTWINGPNGVQSRLNTERFAWEADAGAPGTTVINPAAPPAASSSFDPARVALRLEPYARGLSNPLDVRHVPDGSGLLYVVEKRGTIRIVQNGRVGGTFLDIQRLVRSQESERGLLGLAFHPNYQQNGLLYVNYTDTPGGHTMIVRYAARPDRQSVDPNSAQTVLRIEQPAANHNGGNLVFGPDGYLYIGMGDGGGAGDQFRNAQNPGALLGKMLRVDVNRAEGGQPYAIPADNPFVGNGAYRPEIWFTGMRNPWRYSFDRATGDFWIGDVGQNQYEEIDYVAAGRGGGLNMGWPRMEANHCFSPSSNCDRTGLELPVAEYDHNLGCSVTGGYVYRGKAYPMLAGAYLFGDYCSGRVWSLHRSGGNWVRTELLKTNVAISSFGEDQDGELYATGLSDGTLYRVTAASR